MRMGISLGLQQRGGGGFSPASLFAAGEAGDWFDPSDLSKMWQDTAGTTPITADSQTVARIDGQEGVVSLRQVTAASRPQYKTSGGLHWLQFDGTDDGLDSAAVLNLTGVDAVTALAAARKQAVDSGISCIFSHGFAWNSAAQSFDMFAPDNAYSATAEFFVMGTAQSAARTTSASYNSPYTGVFTGLADISNPVTTLRVSGTQVATSAATLGTGNFGSKTLRLGRRGDGSSTLWPFEGRVYLFVVRGALTSGADLTALETYAGAKAGLTI